MSWQDNIEQIPFTIITGDKKIYTPKWMNAVKSQEYNTALYEFVNVEGTLVLRQKPKGRKFDLEFYFDGEKSVEIGEQFEKSARDSRNWTVKHPFFGNFLCQPISLSQDNSVYNITKFVVPVVETISKAYPQQSIVLTDKITESVKKANTSQAKILENSEKINKVIAKANVNYFDKVYSKIIGTESELKAFKQKISNAVIEIESTVATALTITRTIQEIINYPATIIQTVKARFDALKESLEGILDSFDGSNNDKIKIEIMGGTMIGAMLTASSTNIENEYYKRDDILFQQSLLIDAYNRYLAFLDNMQTSRADNDQSYMPNYTAVKDLNEAFNLTIANLYNIINTAKQEREYTLDKDSNLILLTHRFYGLDSEDKNIDLFKRTNNIGLNELTNIRKGRKVVYYV
ncbi:MAG: hypothetical protein PHW73_01030 [Atribacterota bacterium]|nr:hypothetical protein [Atribacterota bacterium]